jgi:hypothetical protein
MYFAIEMYWRSPNINIMAVTKREGKAGRTKDGNLVTIYQKVLYATLI